MTAEQLLTLAREHAAHYRYARVRAIEARASSASDDIIAAREALADGKWVQLMSLLNTPPTDR